MSDDMADDEQKRTANLARIRDNQRRSRARRKEYLSELEVKYRNCEETGAEASREIQQAARRVLNENKRLRELLRQQGLSDSEIDGFLSERPENPQYPAATTVALEGMIGQRRPCRPGSGCESSSSNSNRQQGAGLAVGGPVTDASQPPPPRQVARPSLHQRDNSTRSTPSSSIQTPSTAQLPALQPQPQQFAMEPLPQLPSIDPNLGYGDNFMWDPHYAIPHTSVSTDSSSCYVAAEAIRIIKVCNKLYSHAQLARDPRHYHS